MSSSSSPILIGACVLLGTGIGIAFFMWMANRTGEAAVIAATARIVVIADAAFTATAVVAQPVTGAGARMEHRHPAAPALDRLNVGALRVCRRLLAASGVDPDQAAGPCERRTGYRRAAASGVPPAVPHVVRPWLARVRGCHRNPCFDDRQAGVLDGEAEAQFGRGAPINPIRIRDIMEYILISPRKSRLSVIETADRTLRPPGPPPPRRYPANAARSPS